MRTPGRNQRAQCTLTFPSTPTPQSDSWIMLTSLPPSPAGRTDRRARSARRERREAAPLFTAPSSSVHRGLLLRAKFLSCSAHSVSLQAVGSAASFTGRGAESQRDRATGRGAWPLSHRARGLCPRSVGVYSPSGPASEVRGSRHQQR